MSHALYDSMHMKLASTSQPWLKMSMAAAAIPCTCTTLYILCHAHALYLSPWLQMSTAGGEEVPLTDVTAVAESNHYLNYEMSNTLGI